MSQNTQGKEKVKFSEKKNVRVYTPTKITDTIDKKWNIICLPLLGFSLIVLGLALIIIGSVNNIEDLIILGCIFAAGSLLFFAIMYTTVCRPICQRNVVETFSTVEKTDRVRPTSSKSNAEYYTAAYYNAAYDPDEDLKRAKDRPQPSGQELYGDKMRSFLATPATTKDVLFYTDEPGTPPPPRLALPSDPGDKKNPVFTMDISKEMTKKSPEISQLELL